MYRIYVWNEDILKWQMVDLGKNFEDALRLFLSLQTYQNVDIRIDWVRD